MRLNAGVHIIPSPFSLDESLLWRPSGDGEVSVFRLSALYGGALVAGQLSDIEPSDLAVFLREGIITEAQLSARTYALDALKDAETTLTTVIMLSSQCPMGCNKLQFGGYCGQEHEPGFVPSAAIRKHIRALRTRFNPSIHRRVRIGFFGGEPLMYPQGIKLAMDFAGEAFRDTSLVPVGFVTTAGLQLTESVAKTLHASGVTDVEVTLDGLGAGHDARRPTKGGHPTFDRIIENLSNVLALDFDPTITIRCNVDSRNHDAVLPFLEWLISERLVPRCSFYLAPIRNWGAASAGSQYLDRRAFASLEMQVFRKLLKIGLTPKLLPNRIKRTCIAFAEDERVLAPNGETYRCTEVPLSELRATLVSFPNQQLKRWNDFDVDRWAETLQSAGVPCTNCRLLTVCGGSCPKEWLKNGHPCPPFKDNIVERIVLFARIYWNELPCIGLVKPPMYDAQPSAAADVLQAARR